MTALDLSPAAASSWSILIVSHVQNQALNFDQWTGFH